MDEVETSETSNEEVDAVVEQTENDFDTGSDVEQADNSEEEAATSNDDGDDSSAAPKNGVQKRIDELTRMRYEAQRQADYWREQALSAIPHKQETVAEQPDNEPNFDDFDDYEEYIKEVAKWQVRQEKKALDDNSKTQSLNAEKQAMQESYAKASADFREKNPDFDLVVNNPSLPINNDMAEVIMMSPVGPELAYTLGKNPQEAARIAGLSPKAAARELGLMEAKLSLPKSKKAPSAPDPVKPVQKGSGLSNKNPDDMTPEEYREWRWKRKQNR